MCLLGSEYNVKDIHDAQPVNHKQHGGCHGGKFPGLETTYPLDNRWRSSQHPVVVEGAINLASLPSDI